ncbi:MAG TPA: ABC transporter ATP-binding protein [Chthoniobacterales bacterium]|jgi:branched-chain amino acid transport system ATP-binding protein|nr:ABC transporter ATP-binding protein [Chthoniobacterales bacterium]
MSLLQTVKLNKSFGGLHVTDDVNLTIETGEIHCLIGPNGAGKSTLFRLLLGEYAPSSGNILYQGEEITRLKPFQRVQRGISVKFQVPGIFKGLTVRQNLEIALQSRLKSKELQEEAQRLRAFLQLDGSAEERAGNLSHGQQQWLEIGMAMSLKPRLLLLDEPTAGMSPEETHMTGEMIMELNKSGISVLAVEHDMDFVRQVAHRVTVLHFGKIFAQGTIDEIMASEEVAQIYLGEPAYA